MLRLFHYTKLFRIPAQPLPRILSHNLRTSRLVLTSCLHDMPPKKTAKRAREETPDESDPEQSTSKAKASSSKKAKTTVKRADTTEENSQPTNVVLPVHIKFPPKIANTTRIASWNICGLVPSQKKVRICVYTRFTSLIIVL